MIAANFSTGFFPGTDKNGVIEPYHPFAQPNISKEELQELLSTQLDQNCQCAALLVRGINRPLFNEMVQVIAAVVHEQKYTQDVTYQSIAFFIKFLAQPKTLVAAQRREYCVYALTCVLLAFKLSRHYYSNTDHIFGPDNSDVIIYGNVCVSEVVEKELEVLNALQWKVKVLSPSFWLQLAIDHVFALVGAKDAVKFSQLFDMFGWCNMVLEIAKTLLVEHKTLECCWKDMALTVFVYYLKTYCFYLYSDLDAIEQSLQTTFSFASVRAFQPTLDIKSSTTNNLSCTLLQVPMLRSVCSDSKEISARLPLEVQEQLTLTKGKVKIETTTNKRTRSRKRRHQEEPITKITRTATIIQDHVPDFLRQPNFGDITMTDTSSKHIVKINSWIK